MHTDLTQRITDIPLAYIAFFVGSLAIIRALVLRGKAPKADVTAEVLEIILVPIVLVYFIIQPLVMKVFYIPSGSMRPTLIDDDHIVVDKLSYRLHTPQRDDVVVFVAPPEALAQSPEDFDPSAGPVYYIKRLIGLPGDIVECKEGYILVNGTRKNHTDIRAAFGISPYDNTARDVEHVKIEASDIDIYDGKEWNKYDADQVAQTFGMPGANVEFHPGVTIRNGQVLDEPFVAEDPDYSFTLVNGQSILSGDETGEQVMINGNPATNPSDEQLANAPSTPVPPGKVIVMGDNRNDSDDSTHWGPLDMDRVTGKARWIFVPIPRMRTIH